TASISFGAATVLTATAVDAGGSPVAATPISWISLDPSQATVPDPAVGRVVAGTSRGSARIVASIPTGHRDTVTVSVVPVPSAISASSGNNQTAAVGALVPLSTTVV